VTGGKNQLQPYGQTYGNFNLPVESFEMLVYDDPPKITLNDNPINVYCLTNCVLDEDHLENKKPLKISQYRKIDGVICVLMTLGQLYSYQR
jgi:phage terminase large subunit-like protein